MVELSNPIEDGSSMDQEFVEEGRRHLEVGLGRVGERGVRERK
jgi:hypothetical protein